jgi:anthranilate phosphoribosyltransferase
MPYLPSRERSMTAPQSWPGVLSALLDGADLPASATAWAMGEIMSGSATPAQIAGFVVALRAKGETVDEVDGMVQAMYQHATPISVPGRAVDVVGTGGDRAHTVNISTMAALVAAGAGAKVVKHGNRAASSACGAADLLEALDIRLDLPPSRVASIADEVGITFCFAPVFHPALRHAAVPRRELGIPTTFNFLGPLANPARPGAQAVGVADARMAEIVAGVLAGRGVSALVFRGDDGLDELTTTTTSRVWVVRDGEVGEQRLDPSDLGIPTAAPEALRGGDAGHNAEVTRRLVAGEPGPVRDAVILNAAAALVAFDGLTGSLPDVLGPAVDRAATSVDSGAAADVLARWVAACAAQ